MGDFIHLALDCSPPYVFLSKSFKNREGLPLPPFQVISVLGYILITLTLDYEIGDPCFMVMLFALPGKKEDSS